MSDPLSSNNSFPAQDLDEHNYQQNDEETSRDFSQNNVSISLSWSLMNQLRYMAKSEGITIKDLLVELLAEGAAKRIFEDQNKPMPSHLMTRNGYVHSDESQGLPQPQMSHHMLNRQPPPHNMMQNRNKFHFQARNGGGNGQQQYLANNKTKNRNNNNGYSNNSNGPNSINNGNRQQQTSEPNQSFRAKQQKK